MIKKTIALLLVIFGALIMLPFGFGLWNESIGIQGQITIAGIESVVPENEAADGESSPSESTDGNSENQPEKSESTEIEEETACDDTQSPPNSGEIGTISSPDNNSDEEAPAPQPLQPVEALDSKSSES